MLNQKLIKPEILTHPHIPKPLHGLNPRNILGKEWWDKQRKEAYARYNYHCIACGVHKSEAMFYSWLEAHEYFEYNYDTGECKVVSIEPLCHSCHNFIHSGRLSVLMDKTYSKFRISQILTHGFNILAENNLECFEFTYWLAKSISVNTRGVKPYSNKWNFNVKWEDYYLLLDGKKYYSQFKNEDEWFKHFSEVEDD